MQAALERPKSPQPQISQRFCPSEVSRADTIFDDLYRLTAETIQNDPVTANNGTIGYGYDAVGNRQSRTSTVAPIPGQSFSGQYDNNDRLTAGFGYDSDGNTTSQGVTTYTYDGLDHLTSVSAPGLTESFVYDGDGNKVSQTVNGVTTGYLVDTANMTGYAQVLEELQGGNVNWVYTYGTNRISEDQFNGSAWNLSFYGYDGQGSVRYLTNSSGTITDTYTYDAFGNLISQTGTTPNVMLYDGEQNDSNLGQYYLRARFMNEAIGRFQTMDTYEGNQEDPLSLHKYEFGDNDPIDRTDPNGRFSLVDVGISIAAIGILSEEIKVLGASLIAGQAEQYGPLAPLQPPGSGVGPIITRYWITTNTGGKKASEIEKAVKGNINRFSGEIAPFVYQLGPDSNNVTLGDVFEVYGPFAIAPFVKTTGDSQLSFELTTLKGHPEAGRIEFYAFDQGASTSFVIRSHGQPANPIDALAYTVGGGFATQTQIWDTFISNVRTFAGGKSIASNNTSF